jgi:hypothetical protein
MLKDAPELSPARAKLAQHQSDLARVDAAVAAQLAKAANLDVIHAAVAPARAALVAFDAEQAAGMARWASSQTTGRPTSAGAQRAEIADEVADAEVASTHAATAQEGFRQASIRAAAPMQGLKREIADAALLVIIDEAKPLLEKVREAIAAAEDAHREVLAATGVIMSGIDSASSEVAYAFAAFGNARQIATARPREPDLNPHLAGWRKLLTALKDDATVSFEDAAALDLPYAPSMPAYNHHASIVAEMNRVMNAPTTFGPGDL